MMRMIIKVIFKLPEKSQTTNSKVYLDGTQRNYQVTFCSSTEMYDPKPFLCNNVLDKVIIVMANITKAIMVNSGTHQNNK